MISVTQRLPDGSTQKIYINPDSIERILPWRAGAMIDGIGGTRTTVSVGLRKARVQTN